MVKLRSLIKSYIAFATEISENVPTREDIGDFVRPFLSEYYTKEEIDEMLENIDLTDYYKKSQVDGLLNDKANVATTYTKSQVDALVSPKADANNVYTKSQTDALISPKADASNVYTKAQVDNLVSPKANSVDVYTKTQTDNLLLEKQNVLTAGSGITIANDIISATGGSGSVGYKLVKHIRWSELFTITDSVNFTPLYDMILHIHYYGLSGWNIRVDKDIHLFKGRKYGNQETINFYASRVSPGDTSTLHTVQFIISPYNMFKPSNDSESSISYSVSKYSNATSETSLESFTKIIDETTFINDGNYLELWYLE